MEANATTTAAPDEIQGEAANPTIRTLPLPERANQVSYPPEAVAKVVELLRAAPRGQGVAFDEAQDSITKARTRASVMKSLVETPPHRLPVHGHAIPSGETAEKQKHDKNGKPITKNGNPVMVEVPTYLPALSINTTKLKAQEVEDKAKAEADATAAAVNAPETEAATPDAPQG